MSGNVRHDASALLAAMLGEPGSAHVAAESARAEISAVNAAEEIAKLIDLGCEPEAAADIFAALMSPVRRFALKTDRAAGRLRAATRQAGLSLVGDRACLAEALAAKLPVLTADQSWAALGLPLEIRVIRP